MSSIPMAPTEVTKDLAPLTHETGSHSQEMARKWVIRVTNRELEIVGSSQNKEEIASAINNLMDLEFLCS